LVAGSCAIIVSKFFAGISKMSNTRWVLSDVLLQRLFTFT